MVVLCDFVEEILGSAFQPLFRKSERARQVGDTGFVAHRLIYLYERLLISRKSWNAGIRSIDFLAITELQYLKDMFDQWKDTPVWDEIGSEIKQREAYAHCVLLLGWVSMLTASKKRVEVVPKSSVSGRRTADAKIFNDYGYFLDAELKAPQSLLIPSNILSPKDA